MGFLSGVGHFFSKVFDGVKKFASSGFGQTLIGIAGSIFGGPIGGVIANAATSLLSGNFKNLAQTGLSLFGGLASKFGLGSLVQNLPAALSNPTGLLSGLGSLLGGNFNLSSIGDIVGQLFGQSGLGDKIGNILNTVSGFLGNVSKAGTDAGSIFNSISNIFGDFGAKPPAFLGNLSDGLNSVLGALNTVQNVIQQITGLLSGMGGPAVLRA